MKKKYKIIEKFRQRSLLEWKKNDSIKANRFL